MKYTEQHKDFKDHLARLYSSMNEKLKFKTTPKVVLLEDSENSEKLLGRTGYYNNGTQTVAAYVTGRHPKDVLRTIAHEFVHHWQNQQGLLESSGGSDPKYAQNDETLRRAEKQAYLLGNIMFRDWEDNLKYGDRHKK